MASKTSASSLATEAVKALVGRGQDIWNNLTAAEREELVGLLTPKDGKPYKTKVIPMPKRRLKITREEGQRLPRASLEKSDDEKMELRVPIPRAAYLKDLTAEEKSRLMQLLKKANSGTG